MKKNYATKVEIEYAPLQGKCWWWLTASQIVNGGQQRRSILLACKPTKKQIRQVKKDLKDRNKSFFISDKFLPSN